MQDLTRRGYGGVNKVNYLQLDVLMSVLGIARLALWYSKCTLADKFLLWAIK